MIMQGGRSLLSEAKDLRTSSRDDQAQVHSDQMFLVMASGEAGPNKRRLTQGLHSKEAQMRVQKQLWTARKPNHNQAEWQVAQESTYFYSWGLDERGVVADDDE